MNVEPEVLIVGWPLALCCALALVRNQLRERGRRRRLGAALHELRRPLQRLMLTERGSDTAGLVVAALADLERALADGRASLRMRPVPLRPLVESAVRRCGGLAAGDGGAEVLIEWQVGEVCVLGDPVRVSQALENLLANALEHGRPPARVAVSASERSVRLSVANPVAAGRVPPRRRVLVLRRRAATASLRGHGLRVVSAVARAHGGRFLFDRDERMAVAMLELPLAPAAA